MRVLVVAPSYPYPGHRSAGSFNEKSTHALSKLCDRVEVLVPRPYPPPLLSSLVPRWKAWASAPRYEIRNGVTVYRPTIPVTPRIAQAFWSNHGAFLCCRQIARKMHGRTHFDAIISFDLAGAGGLAWRIGRDLEIPASGWATGGDIRVPASSAHGRAVTRTLQNLDLVFYQSRELFKKAAELLGTCPEQLLGGKHTVLSRGIPEPPEILKIDERNRIRAKWGVKTGEVVVLYLGRILRQKGMLELLEALEIAASRNSRVRCVLIGSRPGSDETLFVEKNLRDIPWLSERIMLLPECSPDNVWENLCAADIFAFPSHNEGMPNSLLEAMAMGLPAIAFAIPAVRELEAGTDSLALVPPLDGKLFGEAILRLAASSDERTLLGEKGRALVLEHFMVRKSMGDALQRLNQVVNDRRLPN
jgi:teichuronic acid biosynthesis glycosyltransferase TuaC